MLKRVENKNNLYRKLKQVSVIDSLWTNIRQRKILREHQQVVGYWQPLIDHYFNGELDKCEFIPKQNISDKIIWQYWGQGQDEDLPNVVNVCFRSVDEFKGDYTVIRITDKTINDYLDLPDFVVEKRGNPSFNRVFFSDLLRLALLSTYGGVWLDATVLLTDKLPTLYVDSEYFLFQRDDAALYKDQWTSSYAFYWNWHPKFRVNALNSIFFAKKNNRVVSSLLDLMLHYWKNEDRIINYFFFQILYDELIKNRLAPYQCDVVDDTLPHLLQTKILGGLHQVADQDIFNRQSIHKLTYFDQEGMRKLKTVLNAHL